MKLKHRDIMAIERGVKEVHEIFNEALILIKHAGQSITKIEEAISKTHYHTKDAVQKNIETKELQKKNQKRNICFLCCLLIILVYVF